MFKIIAIVIALLVAIVLILAATKPDIFIVERSTAIKAPPEKIFALINDFNAWTAWSPWEKKDPAMKRTFGTATSGKGASYAWEGNKEVGQGRMEIAESVPSSKVAIKLDFLKPFEAHNQAIFTLESKGDTTNVNWRMEGHTPYFAKIFHVFMDMDKMVGKDFEAGLANLKASAEK
jgi:carbon monoxide dehydrogenase subunit G